MKEYIEFIAIFIVFCGLLGILYDRIKYKKGIGVRVIQFLAIVFVVPVILILALEGVLGSESTAALLGAIIGYILSGIDDDDKERRKRSKR